MNCYAVVIGRKPGIYTDTKEFTECVYKFKGAKFKKFTSLEDAQQWYDVESKKVGETTFSHVFEAPDKEDALFRMMSAAKPYAYIDGSYNPARKRYGYGAFLVINGKKIILQGYDDNPNAVALQQVPGELFGCVAVVKEAIARGLKELVIYYDFLGIKNFLTGEWKSEKQFIIQYQEFMKIAEDRIHIYFRHVRGHSGDEGNNEADILARQAVGLSAKKKECWILIEVVNREIKTVRFPDYSNALEHMSKRIETIRTSSTLNVRYHIDLFSAWCDAGMQYNWKIIQIK